MHAAWRTHGDTVEKMEIDKDVHLAKGYPGVEGPGRSSHYGPTACTWLSYAWP